MGIDLILTIVGGIISLTGIYWRITMSIALLAQKVDNNKTSTDEAINRLIKSLDKLEISIEKLTEKIDNK